MSEAREIIDDWQRDYNTVRPHSSLKYLTPQEFADNLEEGYPSSNPV
ncbi:MAG: transposase [Planctomycetes bacterium]|nr:transposase [Planctomycetota bacterium]MBT4029793.1 transposase [Planctomycetota bacterium]MBT4559887.1 transposase [Planctomycetota bacterium]MBT5101222.1 transposase [Planctomycetota bacterium]MBT7012458.1 transposase [Planctomycetota bacterium]